MFLVVDNLVDIVYTMSYNKIILIHKIFNMSEVVQLRVNAQTKKAVARVFKDLGLDLSTGIKIYFQQVLNQKGIPFPLLTKNGFAVSEEEKILSEHRQTMAAYRSGEAKSFKNWAVARKAILED